jgi:hypothetical protein
VPRVPAPSGTRPAGSPSTGGHRRSETARRLDGLARLLDPLRALTPPPPQRPRPSPWHRADLLRLRERAVRLATILAVLAALGTATAAAAAIFQRSTGQTLTHRRAVERTEEHLRRTTTGVGLPMTLDAQSRQSSPCTAAQGHNGRERIEYRYAVRDIGIPNPDVFGAFRRYWKAHGYRVTADDVPGSGVLSVESTADGYLLSLTQDPQGGLVLTVTSPCTVEKRR